MKTRSTFIVPACIARYVTWVKAELTDEQNQRVEQYQEEHGISKPEAISELVSAGVLAMEELGVTRDD